MAKQLMQQFSNTAKARFMQGYRKFKMFGREFAILHMHDDQYAVCAANGTEIVRIIGDSHSCAVLEV